MLAGMTGCLGLEGLGIYSSLSNLALFVPVFPEILSSLLIFLSL